MSKAKQKSDPSVNGAVTAARQIPKRSAKAPQSPRPRTSGITKPAAALVGKTKSGTGVARPVSTTSSDISKSDRILTLLRRPKGASLIEMQEMTGWQPHSVRGFLSGTVRKKLGLSLQSEQSGKRGRRYLIVEA